jgi:hypothetical protein
MEEVTSACRWLNLMMFPRFDIRFASTPFMN